MKVLGGTGEFKEYGSGSVVTIGVFDGVHSGHRAIVAECVGEAIRRCVPSVLLTFAESPRRLVSGNSPCQVTSRARKLELISELSIEYTIMVDFDRRFASLSPEEFCGTVLAEDLGARRVCVGENFHFGAGGKGDVGILAREGKRLGFTVDVVPLVVVDGAAVSSTLIRSLLREGKVREAAGALGRPYSIRSPVVRGHARGGRLGFPTANLSLEGRFCVPAEGVYAGLVDYRGQRYMSAVNVGKNPTFNDEEVAIEAFLMGFSGELYGEVLELEFHERLREEIAFGSEGELIDQMENDVARARAVLSGTNALVPGTDTVDQVLRRTGGSRAPASVKEVWPRRM